MRSSLAARSEPPADAAAGDGDEVVCETAEVQEVEGEIVEMIEEGGDEQDSGEGNYEMEVSSEYVEVQADCEVGEDYEHAQTGDENS